MDALDNDAKQATALRGMTPAERWRTAQSLYWQARQWKKAALRAMHPDWPEERIRRTVKELFLYGRTA